MLSISYSALSQNIGINTNSPNPNAALDVESTDKGLLIPRLTTTQRTALGATLGAVDESLIIYDKDDTLFYFWDGLNWTSLGDTDRQNLIGATLNGNMLQIDIENGNPAIVDLSALVTSGSSNTANTTPVVGSSGVKMAKLVEAQCQNYLTGMAYIGADDNIWSHGYGGDYSYGTPGRTNNALKPVIQVVDPINGPKIGKWKHVFIEPRVLWAITDEGEVFRRGKANNGQLGNGSASTPLPYLTKMSFFETNNIKVKYLYISPTTTYPITSEGTSVFALTEDGDVYCWGKNNIGQLGIGNIIDQLTPVKITGLDFQFIHKMTQSGGAGSGLSVAALDTLNSIYIWGDNGYGQLGLGSNTDQTSPALVPGITATEIVMRRISYGTTLITTPSGAVMGAGWNGDGALGDGTKSNKNLFTPTTTTFTNAKTLILGANSRASIVVTDDGHLYVAGYNGEYGSGLGTASNADVTDFVMPIAPFQGMVKKAVFQGYGSYKSIHVLDTLGRIWACGENRGGQLGTGSTHNADPDGLFTRAMDELNGAVKFVDIQGYGHYQYDYYSTVALTEDGRVMTTGAPQYGKTGQDDTSYFRYYYKLINFQ